MLLIDKNKVLFVCIHNSARSQMAEAYLNYFGCDDFIAESAGLEPGVLNPLVVKVMMEDGIDISGNKTKSVFDFLEKGKTFDNVITVCDETSGERCPYFPGKTNRIHWTFDDPSSLIGNEEEKLKKIRQIRDSIKNKIKEFIKYY
jgi:arsenate reductase